MLDAEMWEGALNAADLEVLPPYRGKGIAGEMYDAIQQVTGKPVMPSPWLSMDGVRFWGKRNAPALRHMLENDLFYDGDNYRKVETFLEEWGLLEPKNKVKLRGFDRKY